MKWWALLLPMLAGSPAWAQEPFRLGVQTHFEQGWGLDWAGIAAGLGAPLVRDEIGWAEAERARGRYDFSKSDPYMREIRAQGMAPLIVWTDTNPLYDRKQTPHSEDGRAGLVAYLDAMLTHYAGTLTRIEIGNEVNSEEFLSGPFRDDPPRHLAATVRAVAQGLKPRHPDVEIICAGTNMIPLQFLRDFFRHGGLLDCDAISIHPYRRHPENADLEIAALRALMRDMGGEKPIHVTEFGKWVEDPAESAVYMVKMVSILAAEGVGEAYWYALMDEPWWPNMGLMTPQRAEKPAAEAFRFLQEKLLPLGRPVPRAATRAARVFEYGDGEGLVFWGVDGAIALTGEAAFFDVTGRPVPRPERLTETPVIALGRRLDLRIVTDAPIADSLYQYDTPPWSYFARRPGIGLTPLETMEWRWSSYRGAPDLWPLKITDAGMTTARFSDGPYHAVERFTAAAAGRYRVVGWWQASKDSEPSVILVTHNGAGIAEGRTGPGRFRLGPLDVTLAAGDTVDFEVAPGGPGGDGSLRRRIRIDGPLP
ncbi:hypothetical protein [Actibacterium sp. MT2.3-13A]|uniref:hypothetical protein n=1 Tax=Actibacterium sp. MT2.3-13A TaxID=2828332 RepID=UPI001BAD2890|nr:hypothetical protein [Actibacterium sp. MT2.3-13A]